MADQTKQQKVMPKGVRKGGTRYPRYTLKDSLVWARKLVSKTHLGPQPQDIIFASVVDSKSTAGEIRVSTLKQYGLMQGSAKAYEASPLAKSIATAPSDEIAPLLAQAALAPPIFKALFDTFHGDEITKAKLRQRAADLQVHPDQAEQCVDMYVAALEFSGLGSSSGEKIQHRSAEESAETVTQIAQDEDSPIEESPQEADGATPENSVEDPAVPSGNGSPPRAIFHVNVNLDASLDTEKLQKHLELLKRYGAI